MSIMKHDRKMYTYEANIQLKNENITVMLIFLSNCFAAFNVYHFLASSK